VELEQLEFAQGGVVPLEARHLIVVVDDVNAHVVGEPVAGPGDDEVTFVVLELIPGERPCRGNGGHGGQDEGKGVESHSCNGL